MRKRLFLVLAVVCIAAVFAGVFAGCNNGDGKGNGGGDKIFTEGASLEEMIAAVESAESFTYVLNVKYIFSEENGGEDQYSRYTVQASKNALVVISEDLNGERYREEEWAFIKGDTVYSVYRCNQVYDEELGEDIIGDEMVTEEVGKFPVAEMSWPAGEYIKAVFSDLTEKDGEIVADPESDNEWDRVDLHFEGDTLTVAYVYVNEYGDTEIYEYVLSGINATTVVIPEEILAEMNAAI